MLQHRDHSADSPTRTTGGALDWIDYRLPIFTFLRRELNQYPTPRNLTYLWNFGSLGRAFDHDRDRHRAGDALHT
jgi:hypothetical protein